MEDNPYMAPLAPSNGHVSKRGRSVSRIVGVALFAIAGAIAGLVCGVLISVPFAQRITGDGNRIEELERRGNQITACMFSGVAIGGAAGLLAFEMLVRRVSSESPRTTPDPPA